MSNRITAFVAFYFKGNEISASIEMDLNSYMEAGGKLPALYPLLARSINIDLYSYEYEMMQVEQVRFRDAQGLVVDHVCDEILDIISFEQAWKERRVLMQLQLIARDKMGVDDLEHNPDLKEALLDAWRLGRSD
ncbi:MAG: hypothetical protein GXP22_10630 [Gammaproteobacteria bacterium]|nr:hypothetical protein [Gammaproteobacteria bacterium]